MISDSRNISVEEAGADPKIAVGEQYIQKNLIDPILKRRRKTENFNTEVNFKFFEFRKHMLEEHEKAHMHWHRATEGGMKGKTAFTKLATPLRSQCKLNDENSTEKVPLSQNAQTQKCTRQKHTENKKRKRAYTHVSLHTRLPKLQKNSKF